jgi:catechol 2,3-dioxygenase-like lactoylglutathione lyase family enzyme
MPRMTDVQCVLAVPDLARSVSYYRDQLGFTIDLEVAGWAFLSRDRFRLMLGECPDAMPVVDTGDHWYFAYITVEDIDGLYRELVAKNVEAGHEPEDKPWGMREFGIRTPDGHRIMFGQSARAAGG